MCVLDAEQHQRGEELDHHLPRPHRHDVPVHQIQMSQLIVSAR